MTLTSIAERLAVELSLPVLTTKFCRVWDTNTQPSACVASALTDCATASAWYSWIGVSGDIPNHYLYIVIYRGFIMWLYEWEGFIWFSRKCLEIIKELEKDNTCTISHECLYKKKIRHNIFTLLVTNFVPGCKVQNDWLHIMFKAHFDCNNWTLKNDAQLFNSNCKPLSEIFLRDIFQSWDRGPGTKRQRNPIFLIFLKYVLRKQVTYSSWSAFVIVHDRSSYNNCSSKPSPILYKFDMCYI